ncbi:MAG: fatty acid desaturase [Ottowia sp.]|nr:fatty acid desaturase [Ottowia sp.]
MYHSVLIWLAQGTLAWSWWEIVLFALAVTHITIASVTIFLHRHQAHRALDLHPLPAHFFRFWLWLTTGMVTKEWAAIHRKHHAKCETPDDPHSPQIRGIETVFWRGAELYRIESRNAETLEKYGRGTPDDWIERNLYSRFQWQGVALMLIIDLALFGALGLTVWAVQMLWIPITAAGIINGIGHYWGYRNYDCADAATNIVPWGILIGGEELHNNHHTFATSAKLSSKWYEFDIGWLYIRCLEMVGLAKVKKLAPALKKTAAVRPADFDTLHAVITNRYEVMARYAKTLHDAYLKELDSLREFTHHFYGAKDWLLKDEAKLQEAERAKLATLMAHSKSLRVYVEMRRELAALWERSNISREQLLQQLQDWCARAEQSGIKALEEFSLRLRRYA